MKLCELGIISPGAIKSALFKKGHKEIVPFYKYIHSRFSNKKIMKTPSCSTRDLKSLLAENIENMIKKAVLPKKRSSLVSKISN